MVANYGVDAEAMVKDTNCLLVVTPDSTVVGSFLCSLKEANDSAQLNVTM